MLNSFVDEKIIEPHQKNKFLNSIKTINKEMQYDFDKLNKKKFISKYGHLRPNTYEISSKNYGERLILFSKNKKNL